VKKYTKIYLKEFKLTIADVILCELNENHFAVDIHHIWARSGRKPLEFKIVNLMALCRESHDKYGDRKQHREMLQQKHNEKLKAAGIKYEE